MAADLFPLLRHSKWASTSGTCRRFFCVPSLRKKRTMSSGLGGRVVGRQFAQPDDGDRAGPRPAVLGGAGEHAFRSGSSAQGSISEPFPSFFGRLPRLPSTVSWRPGGWPVTMARFGVLYVDLKRAGPRVFLSTGSVSLKDRGKTRKTLPGAVASRDLSARPEIVERVTDCLTARDEHSLLGTSVRCSMIPLGNGRSSLLGVKISMPRRGA